MSMRAATGVARLLLCPSSPACGKAVPPCLLRRAAAVRHGYRPWSAAASAEPRLARYQAASAAHQAALGLRPPADSLPDDADAGAGADCDDAESQVLPASAGPLFLHCREVLLLRPRKAAVRVVAPLPPEMRALLQAMEWR